MRVYGKSANSAGRVHNNMACEICGADPGHAITRDVVDGVCIRRTVRGCNRWRIDSYWADRAGHPEYTGRMACSDCARKLTAL